MMIRTITPFLAGKEANGGAESFYDYLLSAVPAGRNAVFKQN